MNEFLANYYGTVAQTQAPSANDELEKMAELTLLAQEAQAQGLSLEGVPEDELLKIAHDLYGGPDAQMEKDAEAMLREFELGGQIMAHAFTREMQEIEKAAGIGEWAGRAGTAIKNAPGTVAEHLGAPLMDKRTVAQAIAESREAARQTAGAAYGSLSPTAQREFDQHAHTLASQRLSAAARKRGYAAAGTATGVAGLGGGAIALRNRGNSEEMPKEGAAFDQLVAQRAYEHLKTAGYDADAFFGVDQTKTAADELNMAVDTAALQFLEAHGVPVQWNR